MVVLDAQNVGGVDDVGQNRPKAGFYHVVQKDADESFLKYKSAIIDFEILAGTTPGQEGRDHREFFTISEKAAPRLLRWALAVGVMRPHEPPRDVPLSAGNGRQLIIELVDNDYTDDAGNLKQNVKISYVGMWPLDHPEVAHVPRDLQALQQAFPGGIPPAVMGPMGGSQPAADPYAGV